MFTVCYTLRFDNLTSGNDKAKKSTHYQVFKSISEANDYVTSIIGRYPNSLYEYHVGNIVGSSEGYAKTEPLLGIND